MKGAESPKIQCAWLGGRYLTMCFFRMEVIIVTKTKWPFGGFFLKFADEKNGTHLYEDYQKELEENPITEEEEKEHKESVQAALAELERFSAEAEQKRMDEERRRRAQEVSELPFDLDLPIQLRDGPQSEDVVSSEKESEPDQETALAPIEPKLYVSDLVGDDYKSWGNGRVILDCGTGRGKNEFIIKKLTSWLVNGFLSGEKQRRILYLCPLNSLHTEMIRRRFEAETAEMGEGVAAEFSIYGDVLMIQTYQHVERLRRNNPAKLEEELAGVGYIVADECHYVTDFSTYNINTYLSLEMLQNAEKDHVVIYMSATGSQVYEILNETSPTPSDRIYTLPQDYRHIAQMYFYARENLVMMLDDLPADEKAMIFMSSAEDLVKMKEQFGDAAGYYCSENNPKYGKQFDALENCIRNRKLQKRFVFTTKAIGMGIEIKDRTVKHIFIDQWKPTDIAQSMGRKRPLDAEDTCTIYFRDYDADWYMSGLQRFWPIIAEELEPVEASLDGTESFAEYCQSGAPDKINRRLEKCRVMEWDASQGNYRVNQLGVNQLRYERDLLEEMIKTSYKQAFTKYTVVDLKRDIQPYRMPVLMNWLKEHLNQPMRKEEMYAGIMGTGVFTEYKGRPMGLNALNEKLKSYGVQILSERDFRRTENRNKTFWRLVEI